MKLFYILGRGRSGSTYFERRLADALGATMLGEARLWPDCYRDDHVCGCGETKTACPFWSAVLESLPNRDTAESAFRKTIGRSALLMLLLPRKVADYMFPGVRSEVHNFYAHLSKTHEISSAIDSSKNPSYGLIVDGAEGVDMTVIHVVRHPLGVVYSWKRQRTRTQDAALYRARKPLFVAALEWTASNFLAEVMKWRTSSPTITVRYEDLGSEKTEALLQKLQAETAAGTLSSQQDKNHAMSGNPGNAARQSVFSEDSEWRTGLSLFEKIIYGAVTYPVFILYMRK